MATKAFVFLTGLIYLFFGISGLFPSLVYMPPPRLRFYTMSMIGHWGFLYTWLPVNMVHDIFYIVIGAAGVVAAARLGAAIAYARGMFFLMTALTFAGFLPFGVNRLWGLMPLFEWNVMLHSITAMLLYYYGFIYPLDFGGKVPANMRRATAD